MYDFHNLSLSPIQTLSLNLAVLSIIVFSLIRSERSLRDESQWGVLILLAIFGVSGRVLLEPIPNVQPVSVLVLLTGVYFGAPRAIALAATIALASNVIFMGHGPWTIFQVIGWGAIGTFGALISEKLVVNERPRINRLAVIAAVSGLAFNWFVSLSILLNTDLSMLVPKWPCVRSLSCIWEHTLRCMDGHSARRDDVATSVFSGIGSGEKWCHQLKNSPWSLSLDRTCSYRRGNLLHNAHMRQQSASFLLRERTPEPSISI